MRVSDEDGELSWLSSPMNRPFGTCIKTFTKYREREREREREIERERERKRQREGERLLSQLTRRERDRLWSPLPRAAPVFRFRIQVVGIPA